MCQYYRNHYKRIITWFKPYYTTKTFYSIMIAHDKHQCTIHFLPIAKIDCFNNCISQVITMCHDVRNDLKHIITWY